MQDSNTTGSKTLTSRGHFVCASILKSHRARVKNHPELARWWKQSSNEEKTQWFIRQKQKESTKGRSRQWDDYQLQEFQSKTSGREERCQVHWMPYDEFETFWLIRSKSSEWIEAQWSEALRDPEQGAKKIKGQWHLPKYKGCFEDQVEGSFLTTGVQRRHETSSIDDMQAAEQEADALHKQNLHQIGTDVDLRVGKVNISNSLRDSQVAHPEHVDGPAAATVAFSRGLKRMAIQNEDQRIEDEQMMQAVAEKTTAAAKQSPKKLKTMEALVLKQWGVAASKANSLRQQVSQKELDLADWVKALNSFDLEADENAAARRDRILNAMKAAQVSYSETIDEFIKDNLTEDALKAAEEEGMERVEKFFDGYAAKLKELQNKRTVSALRDSITEANKLSKEIENKLKAELRNKRKSGRGSAAEELLPANPSTAARIPGVDTVTNALNVDATCAKLSKASIGRELQTLVSKTQSEGKTHKSEIHNARGQSTNAELFFLRNEPRCKVLHRG